MSSPIFVGIDVAFAKQKKLPICAVQMVGGRLTPIPVRREEMPRGRGNVAAMEEGQVRSFAQATLSYIKSLSDRAGAPIRCIAIDAPKSYAINGRRACEVAMDQRGISCFATPSRDGFELARKKAKEHLRRGGAENRLPHANQWWMLVGFALFDELSAEYDCIEVYPQATAHALGASSTHKSKLEGFNAQLSAVAKQTGWKDVDELARVMASSVPGPKHDQLDAFICAWLASLSPTGLEACGVPPDDVIWMPRLGDQVVQPPKQGVLSRLLGRLGRKTS